MRGTKRFNPVEKLCRTRMARPRAVGGYAVVVAIETLSAFSKLRRAGFDPLPRDGRKLNRRIRIE